MSVLTSSEHNLDLHIPQKKEELKLIFFAYGKGRIGF